MAEIACLAFKDVPGFEKKLEILTLLNSVQVIEHRTESHRAAGDEKVMTVQKKLRSRQ
jgi:hypothetical protein